MRVFTHVWFDVLNASFQDISLTIKFTESSENTNQLSGVLRHSSGLDRSLDQNTEIQKITSPRFHTPNAPNWFVAVFQMGYDPCSCLSKGEFELIFETIELTPTLKGTTINYLLFSMSE